MKKGKSGPLSPSRELKNFTNREDELELFRRHRDAPAATQLPMLMFYGVGGVGKTWLLHRLRASLRPGGGGRSGEAVIGAPGSLQIAPQAYLDFDPQVGGAVYHGDSAAALAEIQRQLGVECPRFLIAYAMMLHKQGVFTEPTRQHSGTVSIAWEGIWVACGAMLSSVPGGSLLAWLGKKFGGAAGEAFMNSALGRWLDSQVGNDDLLRLRRMTHQEILPLLPERLAMDLEEHLPSRGENRQCRAVIFFDTFEALRTGTVGTAQQHYLHEKWVCDFYEHLESVLVVVAGRDRLIWPKIDADLGSPGFLEQQRVGGLTGTDARRFLQACGITVGPLQEAILRVSVDVETDAKKKLEAKGKTPKLSKHETSIGYHPFSLGLCADALVAERARGQEPDPEIFSMLPGDVDEMAGRFLRSLGSRSQELWVVRLAQTPRFDETAARMLYSSTPGADQDAAWETLQDYSFVTESESTGWWTLHPQMRDALRRRRERDIEGEREDHRSWQKQWILRSIGDEDDFASLAWYHAYHLDRKAARDCWATMAQNARARVRMQQHYRLLNWWSPLRLEGSPAMEEDIAASLALLGSELLEASLGSRSDNLFRAIACFTAALHVFTEEAFPERWASTQHGMGVVYSKLPKGDRQENLQKAITCFNAALRIFTEEATPESWARMQNRLGIAYSNLPKGNRQEHLQRAIACYEAALRIYTEEAFPQHWASAQNNLGLAYSKLPEGDRQKNLLAAIACYETALRVRTEEVFPKSWASTQNNLGLAYSNLPGGDRQEHIQRAQQHLQRAIACYEAALRIYTEEAFPQHWARTQNNLGLAYFTLPEGNMQENLLVAIACYEAALRVRTEEAFPQSWAKTQNNLGIAFRRQGNFPQAIKALYAAARGHRTIGNDNEAQRLEQEAKSLE